MKNRDYKPTIIASTSRIYLYELTVHDAENFFRLNADSEVMKFTGDRSFAQLEEARSFLQDYHPYQKDGLGRWGIKDKIHHTFVGWCGLKYHEDKGEIDLGFRIIKEEWNKGYATEAAQLCLRLAFHGMDIPKIVGRVQVGNEASIHVLQKLGFTYQHTFIEREKNWLQFEILKQDYP